MPSLDEITTQFLSALHTDGGGVHGLCAASIDVLPVRRAAIAVDEDEAGLQCWYATDDVATTVEAAQTMLGEGPGVTALANSAPVLVPDLGAHSGRWPGFTAMVTDKGVTGAMFALPLQLGTIRFGVLDLYREMPGSLERRTLAAGLHIADLVTSLLLSGGPQLQTDGAEHWWWERSINSREIHQAAGMVIAQTGAPPRDAYAMLRGYAFAEGLSLPEVADRVVRRRLRFDAEKI